MIVYMGVYIVFLYVYVVAIIVLITALINRALHPCALQDLRFWFSQIRRILLLDSSTDFSALYILLYLVLSVLYM